ncbi:MAG: hypothetical protein U1F56_23245 [Rubrivivax sp.]
MKIFWARPQERFACPYAEVTTDLYRRLRRLLDRVGRDRLSAEWPEGLSLTVWRERKSDRLPDIYKGGITSDIYLPMHHAAALFPASSSAVELLEFDVDGVPWCFVNPCRQAAGWSAATSDVELLPVASEDGEQKLSVTSRWITVVDPRPTELDVFYVKGLQRGSPFLSERLVDRIKALELRGLEFTAVGQVVSDAALATPAPPPPPPPPRRDTPSAKGPKFHLEPLLPPEATLLDSEREAVSGQPADPASIEAEIATLKPLFASPDPADSDRFSAAFQRLHVRIGELVRQRFGWSWQAVVRGRSQRFVAVASPDGAFALSGGAVVMRQLQTGEPSLQLLLNLVEAGQLPPAQADRVVLLQ